MFIREFFAVPRNPDNPRPIKTTKADIQLVAQRLMDVAADLGIVVNTMEENGKKSIEVMGSAMVERAFVSLGKYVSYCENAVKKKY